MRPCFVSSQLPNLCLCARNPALSKFFSWDFHLPAYFCVCLLCCFALGSSFGWHNLSFPLFSDFPLLSCLYSLIWIMPAPTQWWEQSASCRVCVCVQKLIMKKKLTQVVITALRSGWSGSILRQFVVCDVRVPLPSPPALTQFRWEVTNDEWDLSWV